MLKKINYKSIQSKQKYSCRLFHSVGNLNCPKYIIKELQKATRMVLNHFWKIMKIVFLTATLTQYGNSVGGSLLGSYAPDLFMYAH